MFRDYRLFLDDMRMCCEKILRYTQGLTLERLIDEEKTYDAVVRNLTIIGEAARHMPQDVRDRYSEVEWRKIVGLRDIAIHEYFGLDEEILWDIIENEVPTLLNHLQRIIPLEISKDQP